MLLTDYNVLMIVIRRQSKEPRDKVSRINSLIRSGANVYQATSDPNMVDVSVLNLLVQPLMIKSTMSQESQLIIRISGD